MKGLKREEVFINLDRGEQFKPEYKATNPQAVVPTLFDGDAKLFQSVAILEYLEEKYPEAADPADRPAGARLGARLRPDQCRRFASADRAAHPQLSDGRAQSRRGGEDRMDPALARRRPRRRWSSFSPRKIPTGKFCHGDNPTIADICLVTQVTPAQLFKCPLETLQASDADLRDLHGHPCFRRRASAQAAGFRGALMTRRRQP